VVIGVGAVAVDLFLVRGHPTWERLAVGAAATALLLAVAGFDRSSLGLVARPQQPLRWWVRATLLAGAAVGLFCVAAAGVLQLFDVVVFPDRPLFRDADHLWWFLRYGTLVAPPLEELFYRLCLCAPLAAALARWPTIVLSGVVFALFHFAYGNPAPDNFIAGYVLAWAYLHSGTLLVPIALHALGNLAVWAVLALHHAWYYQG